MSHGISELFPVPKSSPSAVAPGLWAGITPESTRVLQEVLKENHEKWHIFFNEKGFHNHITHHVIANWAMGANAQLIRAAFKHGSSYQRQALGLPGPITPENFNEHLGDEKYYGSYVNFFKEQLGKKGLSTTLEEYIFSKKANFDSAAGKTQPEMLNRFLAGLLHPMIHAGYGAEFDIPGMVVEGLGQAAVHKAETTVLVPPSVFDEQQSVAGITSRLASVSVSDNTPASRKSPPPGVHAFTILARILKDPKLRVTKEHPESTFKYVVDNFGVDIKKYADEWALDTSDPKQVEKAIEELVWLNTIMYAIPGWRGGNDFLADFFLMHLVTSSIFLSSLVVYLNPLSQERLLRSYLTLCLAWFISRGRPSMNIGGFFAADTANPAPTGTQPTPWEGALTGSSPDAANPNPWLPIIQNAIVHADEHLPKLQRALAHYSALYGSRVAGLKDFGETELEGADKLDGTLFVRAAGLTAGRLGRAHEGQKARVFWDRQFFSESS